MSLFEIGPSIDNLANDWMGENRSIIPATWNGTKADLLIKISEQADSCANFVHTKNALHNTANGRQVCKNRLQQAYAPLIATLQEQTAKEEAQLKAAALEGNTKTYAIIAIVLLVLMAIVILLSQKS